MPFKIINNIFLKKYKPKTSTLRFKNFFFKFFISKTKLNSLTTYTKNNAGRNNTGKVTILSKGPSLRNKYVFTDQLKI